MKHGLSRRGQDGVAPEIGPLTETLRVSFITCPPSAGKLSTAPAHSLSMSSSAKDAEARRDAENDTHQHQEGAPPAYDEPRDARAGAGPSTATGGLDHRATEEELTGSASQAVPTVESPFNFPSQAALPPAYSEASDRIAERPIAIPQVSALAMSPFLPAYAPLLLRYGVAEQSFRAFLDTISAFLTAKVSDRALRHAGDMAKSIGKHPTGAMKGVLMHAKAVSKDVSKNAKRGNVVGAALGVVGGTVTIPLFTVGGLISSAASLPGLTLAAMVSKPKTPRQRAEAYITVANDKWFAARGLFAMLLDLHELAQVLNVPVSIITEAAQNGGDGSAGGQLRTLEPHIEPLEVRGPAALDLGNQTLWLVLTKAVVSEADESGSASASGSQQRSGTMEISGSMGFAASASASGSVQTRKS